MRAAGQGIDSDAFLCEADLTSLRSSYDIVLYEGYAPHGIAIMVETATNNVVRTVARTPLTDSTE